jgi:hypothetical protein
MRFRDPVRWETVLSHIQDAERSSCFECSGLGYKTAGEGYLKFCECVRGEALEFVIRNCRWSNE